MKRFTAASTLVLTLTLTTSGCATTGGPEVNDNLTVQEAKARAQAMEIELAGQIPAEEVASVDQDPAGVLFPCMGEREYQWTGQTKVVLAPGAEYDGAAVTSSIESNYRGRDGWSASTDQTSDGEPRVQVVGRDDEGYLVALSVDKTFVQILSFSPCFILPEGMSPSVDY